MKTEHSLLRDVGAVPRVASENSGLAFSGDGKTARSTKQVHRPRWTGLSPVRTRIFIARAGTRDVIVYLKREISTLHQRVSEIGPDVRASDEGDAEGDLFLPVFSEKEPRRGGASQGSHKRNTLRPSEITKNQPAKFPVRFVPIFQSLSASREENPRKSGA